MKRFPKLERVISRNLVNFWRRLIKAVSQVKGTTSNPWTLPPQQIEQSSISPASPLMRGTIQDSHLMRLPGSKSRN